MTTGEVANRLVTFTAQGEFGEVSKSLEDVQRDFDRASTRASRLQARIKALEDRPVLTRGQKASLTRFRNQLEETNKEVDVLGRDLGRLSRRRRAFRLLTATAALATAGIVAMGAQVAIATRNLEGLRSTAVSTSVDLDKIAQTEIALQPVLGTGGGELAANLLADVQRRLFDENTVVPIRPEVQEAALAEDLEGLIRAATQDVSVLIETLGIARARREIEELYGSAAPRLIELARSGEEIDFSDAIDQETIENVERLLRPMREIAAEGVSLAYVFTSALGPAVLPVLHGFGVMFGFVGDLIEDYPILGQIIGILFVGALGLAAAGFVVMNKQLFLSYIQGTRAAIVFGVSLVKSLFALRLGTIKAAISTRTFGTALRGALAATGIGALLVGFSLLIEHMDDVVGVINSIISSVNRFLGISIPLLPESDQTIDFQGNLVFDDRELAAPLSALGPRFMTPSEEIDQAVRRTESVIGGASQEDRPVTRDRDEPLSFQQQVSSFLGTLVDPLNLFRRDEDQFQVIQPSDQRPGGFLTSLEERIIPDFSNIRLFGEPRDDSPVLIDTTKAGFGIPDLVKSLFPIAGFGAELITSVSSDQAVPAPLAPAVVESRPDERRLAPAVIESRPEGTADEPVVVTISAPPDDDDRGFSDSQQPPPPPASGGTVYQTNSISVVQQPGESGEELADNLVDSLSDLAAAGVGAR